MTTLSEKEWADLFAAGVRSVCARSVETEKDSEALVLDAYKEAALHRHRFEEDDEDDDEDSTWWSRNKHWALPAAIGAGAFWLGADAERNGRPDRSYLSNAGSRLWSSLKSLLRVSNDPVWNDITGSKE